MYSKRCIEIIYHRERDHVLCFKIEIKMDNYFLLDIAVFHIYQSFVYIFFFKSFFMSKNMNFSSASQLHLFSDVVDSNPSSNLSLT